MQDVDFSIRSAGIEGRTLKIYESVLPLNRDFYKNELVINNFNVNAHGDLVSMGIEFNYETLKGINPFGEEFEIIDIEFDSDGRLYASLLIDSTVYGLLRLNRALLTNNGIDWSRGARLNNFTGKAHGFSITANTALFTGDAIIIDEGEIQMYGTPRRFTGLVLGSIVEDDIREPGIIADTYELDLKYGEAITVKGGAIAAQGVLARIAVPLGEAVADAASAWEFPDIKMEVNGDMFGSLVGEYAIQVSNFPVLAKDIEFRRITNGAALISIGTIALEQIPGFDHEQMLFTGFQFNAQEVLAEGINKNPLNILTRPSGIIFMN